LLLFLERITDSVMLWKKNQMKSCNSFWKESVLHVSPCE